MSKFKTGDVFWYAHQYHKEADRDDRELYVMTSDITSIVFATRKLNPQFLGIVHHGTRPYDGSGARLLEDELTEQEQVNYALAMMGLLERSN